MEWYRRSRITNTQTPRKRSGVFRFFFILSIVSAIVFFALKDYVASYGETVVKPVSFSISKGESASSVPKKLKLETGWRSKLYVRYFAPDVAIQVGTYRIPKDADYTLDEVFEKVLPNPDTKDVTVTFLPGWTVYDIDAYLVWQWMISKGEVESPSPELLATLSSDFPFLKGMKSLEWFLYPDTYRVRPGATVAAILSKALSNFEDKVYAKHKDLGSGFYETLILASVVEKEERVVSNKSKVAWALKNRLDGNCSDTWKIIGADATVCYPYAITSKECTPSFIVEHLYDKTEYNTRKVAWLPPTPIANPTDDSFLAARNPEGTACYYLHDSEWGIHFANDSAWHEKNKNLYLR